MPKIYHLSDWHTHIAAFEDRLAAEIRVQKLDQPDLVVLSGDMVVNFKPPDQRNPNRYWDDDQEREKQQAHYEPMIDALEAIWPGVDIIGVPGNHDWIDYGLKGRVYGFDRPEGDILLWNGYKIAGFKGVAHWFGFWKHELAEDKLKILCDRLPDDTDILITHDAPNCILDDARDVRCSQCGRLECMAHLDPNPVVVPRNIGSIAIKEWVDAHPDLKLHCFGHVHEQGGEVQVRGNSIFSNGAGSLNVIELKEKA